MIHLMEQKSDPFALPQISQIGHLQTHRCVAIVPTLPFLHAAPNDLKALEINKAPIPGGDWKKFQGGLGELMDIVSMKKGR